MRSLAALNLGASAARSYHLVVFGNRAELRRAGATTLLSLATAAEGLIDQPETATPATNRLHAALVASGLPASLGEVDEGYPLAITETIADLFDLTVAQVEQALRFELSLARTA